MPALAPSGKKLHDKALPNDEQRLRALFTQLAEHGRVLMVVDQPVSIGALPVAVARRGGLPGRLPARPDHAAPGRRAPGQRQDRRPRRLRDRRRGPHPLPHTMRRVDTGDETPAELEVLIGFDDDLAGEANRPANRIRSLLVTIHPALEKAL